MDLGKEAISLTENLNDPNVGDCDQSNYEEPLSDHSDITLNVEDIWDDSLLIKMYETTQKIIDAELVKLSTKTSETTKDTKEINISNNNTFKNQKQKMNVKDSIDKKPLQSSVINWKEGDYCQATYLEDNVDYEAKIISISNIDQTCLIRYIGYSNEEIRNLSDLKPSEGEKVRKLQIEMAIQDGYITQSESVFDKANYPQEINFSKQLPHIVTGSNQLTNTSRIIPPPPTFLTENNSIPNNQNVLCENEDDVLASMLMSWYMTGYHTGYYQARKDMKTNR